MDVVLKRVQLCNMISMDVNPFVLEEGMTEPFTLRFAFLDESCTKSSATPRTDDAGTSTNVKNTNTDTNTHHVTSIRVERKNHRGLIGVATVNKNCPAPDLYEVDPPKVTSHIAADGTEQSFLEMTWTNPGPEQAGEYTCEITTTDAQGDSIVSKARVTVWFQDSTMKEAVPPNDVEAIERPHTVMKMVPKIVFEREIDQKIIQEMVVVPKQEFKEGEGVSTQYEMELVNTLDNSNVVRVAIKNYELEIVPDTVST